MKVKFTKYVTVANAIENSPESNSILASLPSFLRYVVALFRMCYVDAKELQDMCHRLLTLRNIRHESF